MDITFEQFYEDVFGKGSFQFPVLVDHHVSVIPVSHVIKCYATSYYTRNAKNDIIVAGLITVHTTHNLYGILYDDIDRFSYSDVMGIAQKINENLDCYRMMFI